MNKAICVILATLTLLLLCSCDGTTETSSEESSQTVSSQTGASSSDPTESAKKQINSLNYRNTGKMGDTDGPAFAVYSKIGYSGASVDLNLADMEIQTVLPDGRYINGYTFLGIDVYEGAYWINCIDTGLCWSGESGGWHIFYNVYEPYNEETPTWYESSKKLPKNGTYRMSLEITDDNYAVLTVESLTGYFKDSVTVEVKGAKKNGSNTSFLFNTALDFPENTKTDASGAPSEDWTAITLANSNKDLYLRKLHATNLMLTANGTSEKWTDASTSATSIWPDMEVSGFDYSPTEIYLYDEADEYYINLDMNKK